MLNINNLTVKVEDKIVLDNFNLDIKDGEIHVIMGPNGAGKSTLTKTIMNDSNYKVVNGDIIFNNESILNLTTDKRALKGIFLAMQDPISIDGVSNSDFLRTILSSKENKNINLYSFIKMIDEEKRDLKIPDDMIHRSVNKGFSGGEKKKNEVLQMKVLKPTFVMFDEIDSGVDVDSLKVISKNINKYKNDNSKCSYLIITHYTHLLNYVKPDYVHIMKNGKIIATGDFSLAKKIENNGFNFDEVVSNVYDGSEVSE